MVGQRLTDEQKITIVTLYQTGEYSCNELGRIFNVQGQNIVGILKRRNITILANKYRKYSLNEHYFDIIDTEQKAYFLGLLYADGCNHIKRGNVIIGLQERDKNLLEKLNKELECSKPLYFKDQRSKNPNWQNTYILDIHSRKISDSLFKLGMIQAKSLTLKFPTNEQVPTNLIRPFLLGCMDGDGSFSIYDGGKITPRVKIGFVSTLDFCLRFQEILKEEMNSNCSIGKRYKDRDTTTRQLSISGNVQVMRVLDWLYKDSTIFLQRKYDKYISMKIELEKFVELRRIRRENGKN